MPNKSQFSHSGPVAYAPQDEIMPERSEAESAVRDIPGVRGIGEGQDDIGNPAWIVYVTDPSVAKTLPATIAGRSVVPAVSGEIDIQPA
jgi:hypothetical protein